MTYNVNEHTGTDLYNLIICPYRKKHRGNVMKRKIIVLVIAAILVFSCVAFAACGNNTVKNQLSYGKKYIYDSHLGNDVNKATFFIFYKNGTGVFHYFYEEYDGRLTEAYTINFKYVVDKDGEVVYCFYDSFKYDDMHNDPWDDDYDESDWSAVLNFTNKFLYRIDTAYPHFFITEQFSKDIPNFGK